MPDVCIQPSTLTQNKSVFLSLWICVQVTSVFVLSPFCYVFLYFISYLNFSHIIFVFTFSSTLNLLGFYFIDFIILLPYSFNYTSFSTLFNFYLLVQLQHCLSNTIKFILHWYLFVIFQLSAIWQSLSKIKIVLKSLFFIQYFRLLFTYPPLVAGRLPDGKKSFYPQNPQEILRVLWLEPQK